MGDPDERQRPITLVHERSQLGAGVTVQGRGVPGREQVMAAVMGDIDRLAGRRVGIELSGQPTIAPQGGADEPESGQDLSAGEIRGHDVVPVLVVAQHEHDGLVVGEAAQDPERLPGGGLPHIAGRDQHVEGGRLGPELIRIQHRPEVQG
ncbi:hypothetical protein [Methylobacterium fujisawaense]|uniref:hypothetical protein n=1 Tax=Methylobacterium fujisawaense TaxID=107400 RepID=UPI00244956CA|nr:hypothetical protein [Methylobacterium fujisawaense]MDH3030395.1 hypothetical protein [Methylobacterium fujisawaense]